jgi:hypothetical protein
MNPETRERLSNQLQDPEGFSSYKEVPQWLTSCCKVKVAYQIVHPWAIYRRWRKIKSPRSCSREKQKAGAVEEFKKTVISN